MPYTGTPTAGSTDEVRLLLGDTDTSDELLSDVEVQYFITTYGAGILAAAKAARALMAKFARFVDSSVGEVSESASQRIEQFRLLAVELETQAGISVPIFAGGVEVSETLAADQDSSQSQPAFKRGQFDNPRVGENSGSDGFDSGGS